MGKRGTAAEVSKRRRGERGEDASGLRERASLKDLINAEEGRGGLTLKEKEERGYEQREEDVGRRRVEGRLKKKWGYCF